MNKKQLSTLKRLIKATPVKLKPYRFEVVGVNGVSHKTIVIKDVDVVQACGRMRTMCSSLGLAWNLIL